MNGNAKEKYEFPDLPPSHNANLPEVTLKESKKGTTWRQAWVDFTQNTSIHGLRYVWMEHAFLIRK